MLKFEEALIYRHLEKPFFNTGTLCDIDTSIGYMTLDNTRMKCFPLKTLIFSNPVPYFFLRNEGILYLMKREAQFYA